MNAYLDSSVLLRVALRQGNQLAQWHELEDVVTSALTRVECLRTIDRLALMDRDRNQLADHRRAVIELLARCSRLDLNEGILMRAEQPLPVALGTLDALHLATALVFREFTGQGELGFATHDLTLAKAARTMGFAVIGSD